MFVTWRLSGSLPKGRFFPSGNLDSGRAFVALDRLLDDARCGPLYLKRPEIAGLVRDALDYCTCELKSFQLHAFTIMANHVHVLISPLVALPKVMKSLKGFTAKRSNAVLGLTGRPFWAEESYDHLVRSEREFERIRFYIEDNPVRAGLVHQAADYTWSSAAGRIR